MSRYRRALVTVVVGAFLVGLVPGLVAAGNGVGAAFQLGVNNTVNAFTMLTANAATAALRIQNTGSGGGIEITVGAGKAPITVSAGAGKATNLNADSLDGRDSTSFQNRIAKLSDLNNVPCGPGNTSRVLAATGLVRCVSPEFEPNGTMASSLNLPNPDTVEGIAGNGDADWYLLGGVCYGGFGAGCYFTASLDAIGLSFDVYRNSVLIRSDATLYNEFTYTSTPYNYHIRVHGSAASAVRYPYALNVH